MKAPGKKVSILGLGISGFQSALFLKEKGFDLFVSDQGDSEALRNRAQVLIEKGIPVEWGKHTTERISERRSIPVITRCNNNRT